MRISDWSSDVCSSDLPRRAWPAARAGLAGASRAHGADQLPAAVAGRRAGVPRVWPGAVGATGTRGAGGAGTRRVRGAAAAKRAVAVALPLRPDGVAVAPAYLRRAANAETGCHTYLHCRPDHTP